MLDDIMRVIEVLMPAFVVIVTVYGGIMVAKLNKVQKNMVTNHGSTSLGNAIDLLRTKVDAMADNQDELISTVKQMHQRDKSLDERLGKVEEVVHDTPYQPKTGPVQIVRQPIKMYNRRRK